MQRKRSQAQKVRWRKLDLADPVVAQLLGQQPAGSPSEQMAASPPSAPRVWRADEEPSHGPAVKTPSPVRRVWRVEEAESSSHVVSRTPPPTPRWFFGDDPTCSPATKKPRVQTSPQLGNIWMKNPGPSCSAPHQNPRGDGFHRVQALEQQVPGDPFHARRGTGYRHAGERWPTSQFTGKSHKLVVPAESPDKKFVFIVGDSHLRSIVDGFVTMPEGRLTFGAMSTPGATAAQLRTEVLNTVLPRTPDVVCLLAPSNNLTASRTIGEAAEDFKKLLSTVCSSWPKVFVLDFPPRLNIDVVQQEFLRQEYHRLAAQMGVRYVSVSEHFPLHHLDLWSRDGVHLSDDGGMKVLVGLLCRAASVEVRTAAPEPIVLKLRRSAPVRRFSPKLVVMGEEVHPRSSNPFEWTVVQKKKRVDGGEHLGGSFQRRTFQQQVELNPTRFSSATLRALDEAASAECSSRVNTLTSGNKKKQHLQCQRVESQKKRSHQQMEETWRTPADSDVAARMEAGKEKNIRKVQTTSSPKRKKRVQQVEQRAAETVVSVDPAAAASAETDQDMKIQLPAAMATSPAFRRRQHHRVCCVRATHSQSDDRYSDYSRNQQCTCNALVFLTYLNEGLKFNTADLDRVLEQGFQSNNPADL